jgi:NTE family protein
MPAKKKVDVQGFIRDSGAENILHELQKYIAQKKTEGKDFIVSDVYDARGNQYLDLVQEGGGVWGIALLGYTYILEKVGIRFFSLAGTSAGAINTILLAATKNKEEEKTETIIKKLLELDMFSFVDGKKNNTSLTRWIKKLIQKFVLRRNYIQQLRKITFWLSLIVGLCTIATLITGIFVHNNIITWLSAFVLLIWIVLIVIILFLIYRIKSLAKTGYGLNAGHTFHKWICDRLMENKISTLEDLKNHFSKYPPDLSVRHDKNRDKDLLIVNPPSKPMLTIITSDITTGNKIEFPRMWDLYWDKKENANPADFIRASMSIPVFFETYKIKVSDKIDKPTDIWKAHINWKGKIPEQVRFVDGGALSNFPINVFYNPKYVIPRMPTFGIRLGNREGQSPNKIKNIQAYIGAIISTLRSNTDKDFINKNKAFTLGIKEVDLSGHSWLNFFMNDNEKQKIFRKGAEAAAEFLKAFDWEDYKKQRFENNELLQDQRENPNNW